MVASMFTVSLASVSWLCGSLRRPLLCCVFQGILSDDHGLAAALWRTFFNGKCEDPRHLELLVEYVRKQVSDLSLPSQVLATVGPPLGLSGDHERLSYQGAV